MGSLLLRAEVGAQMSALRAAGATIVSTNGCFDVLHVGHVRYLQQAQALGSVLIVGLNSDESVRALKGPARPVVPEDERAEMLCALRCVDYVTIFGETLPDDLLALIRPDIHVKGGDYSAELLPEAAVVRAHGGVVQTLPLVQGRSTTNLVQRILAAYSAPSDANGTATTRE